MTEDKLKALIVGVATKQFLSYGIRSVTMDDLANALGMSKKTIYQYFADKNELVMAVTHAQMDFEADTMEKIVSESRDCIEEMHSLSRFFRDSLSKINPVVLYDLRKYHREAWALFENCKSTRHLKILEDSLRRGQKQGVYRNDFNPYIIARMRMAQMEWATTEAVMEDEQLEFKELAIQLFDFFVHGLISEKGKELLKQYNDQNP